MTYQLDSFLSHHCLPPFCKSFFFWLKHRFNHHLYTFPNPSVLTQAVCVRVCSVYQWSIFKFHSGIQSPESCDCHLCCCFFFYSRFSKIDCIRRAGLQIDTSAWVWQLRGQRQALNRHKSHVLLLFFLQPYSGQPLHWIINQFTADKKFISLFKIILPPPIVEAVCKSLEESKGGKSERKRKGGGKWEREKIKEVTFTGGEKKNEIEELMGERLAVSEGEKVKGMRVRCSTNYHSASRWRFPIICSPRGEGDR